MEVESLLIEASQVYESSISRQECEPDDLFMADEYGQSSQRFGDAVTEEDILRNIESAIPKSTKKSTAWAVRIWASWVKHRTDTGSEVPSSSLQAIDNVELNHWMTRFKKRN